MKRRGFLALLLLIMAACSIHDAPVPTLAQVRATPHARANEALTPGDRNTSLTVAQLCVKGFTADERTATQKARANVYAAYGIAVANRVNYRLDDLESLSLGGVQTERNLWPQPAKESFVKDGFERKTHNDMCAGKLTPAQARQLMQDGWG